MDDGLRLTVIEKSSPFSEGGPDFYAVHRLWLGGVPGVEWLHEALEEAGHRSAGHFSVESTRRSHHGGASGEWAEVVFLALGGFAAKAFLESFFSAAGQDAWSGIRELAQRRRHSVGWQGDPAPDFFAWGDLAAGMRRELAEAVDAPESRFQLVRVDHSEALALSAVYRDTGTGYEYAVEVGRDWATFTRLDPPEERDTAGPGGIRSRLWRRIAARQK